MCGQNHMDAPITHFTFWPPDKFFILPCEGTYRRHAFTNDRYVIRTRNLQDWNLTRYRCANRSKAPTQDAAAVHRDFRVARDRHVFHDAAALALVLDAPAC